MSTKLDLIALDADDTLWENQHFYDSTEEDFHSLLADYADPDHLRERLLAAERKNLRLYGYGFKGFILSMIETAIDVTDGRIPTSEIQKIIERGHDLMQHPVTLIDGVEDTLKKLADQHRLVLVTKGDLFDQERKIAQSGLADLFDRIEIVSEKTPDTYRRIFESMNTSTTKCLMAGNSLKSDVLPVLELGSWGVFVPHNRTWIAEHADEPTDHPRFHTLDQLVELPDLIPQL